MENNKKYFTPYEANKTLPLVRKIISDILEESRSIRELVDLVDDHPELHSKIHKKFSTLETYLDELSEIGCHYKQMNVKIGLVDYPALINGEKVYLCWKSDEDEIKYYHGITEGFAGRKLIPEEYFIEKV